MINFSTFQHAAPKAKLKDSFVPRKPSEEIPDDNSQSRAGAGAAAGDSESSLLAEIKVRLDVMHVLSSETHFKCVLLMKIVLRRNLKVQVRNR